MKNEITFGSSKNATFNPANNGGSLMRGVSMTLTFPSKLISLILAKVGMLSWLNSADNLISQSLAHTKFMSMITSFLETTFYEYERTN